MKNKLLIGTIFVLALFLSATAALATGLPMFLSGTVEFNGELSANRPVVITDVNLAESWTVYTNENAVYQAVLNNFKDAQGRTVADGHTIHVDACDVNLNSQCRQTVVASYDPIDVDFDIAIDDAQIPDKECPAPIVCDACPVVDECQEPESDGVSFWYMIATGLAGLGVGSYFIKRKEALSKGVGLKFYTGRDGSEKIFHKHPGIKGYHNPETRHIDADERHPKGELTPKYEKDSDGEWYYVE